jgi:GrpB-like predicted nucleotidyltransferase (UPF0157 family)
MSEGEDAIVIQGHDPRWKEAFEQEKGRLEEALGDSALEIHHIGSTAVPGLAAKPVIDILVAVRDLGSPGPILERLAALGYGPEPQDDQGRLFLRKGRPRTHHLHLVRRGTWPHYGHIWFRDYLMDHPPARQEYERLKRILASRHGLDRDAYVRGKEGMVEMVLRKATRERLLLPRSD